MHTAFWSIVLIGATVSIAAGFAGGRSIVAAGSLKPLKIDTQLPPPIRRRIFVRNLVGAHSLEAAEAFDPYGDPEIGVASRAVPAGAFDARRDRPRIAVIVVDAGRAGSAVLGPFMASPFPLALAISPGDDGAAAIAESMTAAGKTVVVDANTARPAAVARLLCAGATGVIASLDEARAAALMHALDRGTLVVDAALAEDDAVYRLARKTAHTVVTRDVIVDARDDGPYVDYMFRDALAIAQRNGFAVVALHARMQSFNALTRFADRAQRDGADLVALADLHG